MAAEALGGVGAQGRENPSRCRCTNQQPSTPSENLIGRPSLTLNRSISNRSPPSRASTPTYTPWPATARSAGRRTPSAGSSNASRSSWGCVVFGHVWTRVFFLKKKIHGGSVSVKLEWRPRLVSLSPSIPSNRHHHNHINDSASTTRIYSCRTSSSPPTPTNWPATRHTGPSTPSPSRAGGKRWASTWTRPTMALP